MRQSNLLVFLQASALDVFSFSGLIISFLAGLLFCCSTINTKNELVKIFNHIYFFSFFYKNINTNDVAQVLYTRKCQIQIKKKSEIKKVLS